MQFHWIDTAEWKTLHGWGDILVFLCFFFFSLLLISPPLPFHWHLHIQHICSSCQSLLWGGNALTWGKALDRCECVEWLMLNSSPPLLPSRLRFCLCYDGLLWNQDGRPVVPQIPLPCTGPRPSTVSGVPTRLSLLQPHSGVRLYRDQRNPPGCPCRHGGQLADR